jgi:hypothetical protein
MSSSSANPPLPSPNATSSAASPAPSSSAASSAARTPASRARAPSGFSLPSLPSFSSFSSLFGSSPKPPPQGVEPRFFSMADDLLTNLNRTPGKEVVDRFLPEIREKIASTLQERDRKQELTKPVISRLMSESTTPCTLDFIIISVKAYETQYADLVIRSKKPDVVGLESMFAEMFEAARANMTGTIANFFAYGFHDAMKENLVFNDPANPTRPTGMKPTEDRFPACKKYLQEREESVAQSARLAGQGEGGTRRRRRKGNKTKARKVKGKKSRR